MHTHAHTCTHMHTHHMDTVQIILVSLSAAFGSTGIEIDLGIMKIILICIIFYTDFIYSSYIIVLYCLYIQPVGVPDGNKGYIYIYILYRLHTHI